MAALFYGALLENTTSAVAWNQGCHVINVDTKIVIWAYHINGSAINNYRSPGTLMPRTHRIPKQRMCLVLWLVFHFGVKQVRAVTLSTWAVQVMHVSNMTAVVLHHEICILVYFTLTRTRFSAKIDLEMTYRQSYQNHTSVSLQI